MHLCSENISENETKFLLSLLSGVNKNDVQIAREIKTSKATVNRIRKRLEKEGILEGSIPLVNLDSFNIELYAVVMFEWKSFSDKKLTIRMEKEFIETPQVVYLSAGESSSNLNYIAMLGFQDLSDYHAFFNEFREKYQKYLGGITTFFIPSKRILKQDYTDLAKFVIKKGEYNER